MNLKLNIFSLLLCFVILGSGGPSWSLNDLFITQSNNQFFLKTKGNCQFLKQQTLALIEWNLFLNQPLTHWEFNPVSTNDFCQTDMTSIIPLQVKNIFQQKPFQHGPNCWNSTLYLQSMNSFLRFASDHEMTLWLNSKYCRQLKAEEKNKPGDVIAIRNFKYDDQMGHYDYQQIEELHGMTYISDFLVFSKDTSRKDDGFNIETTEDVFAKFRVDNKKCFKKFGHNRDCLRWANHYRCISPQTDLKLTKESDLILNDLYDQTEQIENKLSTLAFTPILDINDKILIHEFKNILDLLEQKIIAHILQLKKTSQYQNSNTQTPDNQNKLFFCKALQEKITSLQIQIQFFK